jgi:hypothetical protein
MILRILYTSRKGPLMGQDPVSLTTPFGRRGLRVAKQGYSAPNDHGGAGGARGGTPTTWFLHSRCMHSLYWAWPLQCGHGARAPFVQSSRWHTLPLLRCFFLDPPLPCARRLPLPLLCQILPLPICRYRFKFQSNLVWDSIKSTNKILKLTKRARLYVDLYPNPTAPLYFNSSVAQKR